jgi:5-(carboxyamino)imidazole ribonucleotide mutase
MHNTSSPRVAILMGSDSDWAKIEAAAVALDEFGVPWEARVLSAHRTPDAVCNYARSARERGIQVILAAAGGAAHLGGVVAAHTTLPVVGIPVPTADLGGLDSLLSIVQMPGDVPVVSVAVGLGGPRNAGLFAVQILANSDPLLRDRLDDFKRALRQKGEDRDSRLQQTILSTERRTAGR